MLLTLSVLVGRELRARQDDFGIEVDVIWGNVTLGLCHAPGGRMLLTLSVLVGRELWARRDVLVFEFDVIGRMLPLDFAMRPEVACYLLCQR